MLALDVYKGASLGTEEGNNRTLIANSTIPKLLEKASLLLRKEKSTKMMKKVRKENESEQCSNRCGLKVVKEKDVLKKREGKKF